MAVDPDPQTTLLAAIEQFCAERGIAESTFGRWAMADGRFVTRLRAKKRMWPETIEKAHAFIRAERTRPYTNPKRKAG